MERPERPSSMKKCSSAVKNKIVNNINPVCHSGLQLTLKGKFVIVQNRGKTVPGKLVSVQVYSGTEVDPSKCTFYTPRQDNIIINEKQK